jgi:uncharacterized protein YjbI with pentapeptide repeats
MRPTKPDLSGADLLAASLGKADLRAARGLGGGDFGAT